MTVETPALTAGQFDAGYKARMIQAYPAIAKMSPEEMFYGSTTEREAAFQRVLDNETLRRTHQAYLDDHPDQHWVNTTANIERRSPDDD